MVSLRSTTATRCRSHSSLSTERSGGGWGSMPQGATLAFDLSQALLWCRCAPPQPPDADPTQARAQNGGGWGSMPQGCKAGL